MTFTGGTDGRWSVISMVCEVTDPPGIIEAGQEGYKYLLDYHTPVACTTVTNSCWFQGCFFFVTQ